MSIESVPESLKTTPPQRKGSSEDASFPLLVEVVRKASGAAAATFPIMPLQNYKIYLQRKAAQDQRRLQGILAPKCAVPQENPVTPPKSRAELWRGNTTFMKGFVPTTVVQGIATDGFKTLFTHWKKVSLSDGEQMGASFLGGALPAVFLNPASVCLVNKSSFSSLCKIHGVWKVCTTALVETQLREGGSSTAFFVLAPVLKKELMNHTSNELLATTMSGVLAGSAGMVSNHLLDTRIVNKQERLGKRVPITRDFVFRTGWTGLLPRIGMGAGGVTAYQLSLLGFDCIYKWVFSKV